MRAQSKAFVLAQATSLKVSSSLAHASSDSKSVRRCDQRRMGFSHIRSSTRPKSMESSHELRPHQCEGVCSGLDCPSELSLEKGNVNQTTHGQHLSGELHQSRRVNEIDSSLVMDSVDFTFDGFEVMDSVSSSHQR